MPLVCFFEIRVQDLNLSTFIFSFVNNGLLISKEKTYNTTLQELYSSYEVVINLIVLFDLVMKHDKLEIFHFSRLYNSFSPELNLSAIGILTLKPKTYWRYLGLYFDWHMSSKKHIFYYSTKTLSTVKVVNLIQDLYLL